MLSFWIRRFHLTTNRSRRWVRWVAQAHDRILARRALRCGKACFQPLPIDRSGHRSAPMGPAALGAAGEGFCVNPHSRRPVLRPLRSDAALCPIGPATLRNRPAPARQPTVVRLEVQRMPRHFRRPAGVPSQAVNGCAPLDDSRGWLVDLARLCGKIGFESCIVLATLGPS